MDEDLCELLKEWNTPSEYVERLKEEEIDTLSTLELLDQAAVCQIFDKLGPRLQFERRLSQWKSKREAAGHTDEILAEATPNVIAGIHHDGSVTTTAGVEVLTMTIETADTELATDQDGYRQSTLERPLPSEPTAKKRAGERPSLYDLDLARLCASCLNGKCVVRYYKLNNDLDDVNRNLLADVILNDYLKDEVEKKFPPEVENSIADIIVSFFPTEKKEVWVSANYRQRSKSAGRGKLLSRYYDLRRKMNKSGLLKSTDNTVDADDPLSDDEDANADPELADHLLWLRNNKQPWSKVSSLWELTSKHRMRYMLSGAIPVATYLAKYPALQDPSGYLLLAADFDLKYPASGMSLFVDWPMLVAFVESKVPNPENIKKSMTEDGKKLRVIQALSYLFPVVTCARKGKKQWRPSRQEVAEALVLHVKVIGDINISLASRAKEKYEPYNLSLGPQAVVVGSDLDDISHSYVRINSTMYEVENPLKAVDITFKAMHALDCKYHRESEREWLYLEKAIYKLNADKPDGKMSTILKSYSDFKKNNQ